LGRFFHDSDEHGPNSAPYVVLSYAYWQSHFQGDPGVVGRAVRVNKYSYTILGVAPAGFRGTELFYAPDLWAPIVNQQQIEGSSNLDSRSNRGRWVIGRLRSGITPAKAIADLNSIAAYMAKSYPKEDDGIGFGLARPGLAGDILGGPVHAFVAGLILVARTDPAGSVRESRRFVRCSCRGSHARSRPASGSWFQPGTHSAPTAHGSSSGFDCRRRAGHGWKGCVAAHVELLASRSHFPHLS